MKNLDRKELEKRVKSLEAQAIPYLSTWKDIKSYINPVRGSFGETPSTSKAIDHKTMLNGHPRICARTLGSGMASGMTSESRTWFNLTLDDKKFMEYDSARLWIDDLQARMTAVFSRSNIYSVLGSMYEEMGSFGTAAAAILDSPETILRGRNFTIGTYWIGRDSNGKPNAFARKYWATVGQLVELFGEESLSPAAKSSYNAQKIIDTWVTVIHLIEVHDDRIPDVAGFNNMPYRSVQWEEGSPSDCILHIGGYEEFPILAPRWQTVESSDLYGIGLGWDALGDSKMLQKMERKKLLGLDKKVDPPVQKDALVTGQVNTLPGGITSSSSSVPNAGVRPTYQVDVSFSEIDAMIIKAENAISKTFYEDLFLMLLTSDRKQVTAYEIAKKVEEREFILGQVLQNVEDELLDPLVGDRTFNIMLRRGIVPKIPQEIQGQHLKVEYTSVLAQAQKMTQTAGIEQVCRFAIDLSQVKTDIIDKLNLDEALEIYSRMVGTPAKLLSSDEFVKSIRQAREEAAQEAQEAIEIKDTVETIKNASEIKAEPEAVSNE